MIRIAVLSVSALLLAPSVAAAAELSVQNGVVVYQAAPGEQNDLDLNWGNNPSAGPPTFTDNGAEISYGAGCDEAFTGSFYCPAAGSRPDVVVRLGDGDDRGESINSESEGEHAELYGEDGNDLLYSEEGSDLLDGGAGDDEMQPDDEGSGPGDVVVGGPGRDKLQLVDSLVPTLTATLDGVADDGGPGEADNYGADIEDVQGSRVASNRIVGTNGPNVITILQDSPALGDDVAGLGGNDTIETQDGPDKLDGGDGDDSLVAGAGDDLVIGGPGRDSMDGDAPGTFGVAFAGNDRIEARDGIAEPISCGAGSDVAVVDAADIVPSDPGTICEVVQRAAAAAKPSIGSKKLRVRKKKIAVGVRCAAGATCRGTVVIKTAKKVKVGRKRSVVTIGRAKYTVPAGKSRTVRVKPSSKAKRLFKRVRSVKVRVELRSSKGKRLARRTVTLRRS